MAKIASAFKCILCKEPLNFPNDISIVDFMILVLQFYKNHEVCEAAPPVVEKKIKAVVKRKKRTISRNKH